MMILGLQGLEAQSPNQVIIANGGVFGSANIVTIASLDIATGTYMVFDSFPASSVQHVLIHDQFIYVCADSTVMKYERSNHQRLAMARVYGARQSAIYQDKLIVSKGYGTLPGSGAVQILNASDLSNVQGVQGIIGDCEGVVVVGDTAYVANPGLFAASTGSLAVVNLPSASLTRTIDMDTMGKVVQDLYAYGNAIFALSTGGFGSSQGFLSLYDFNTTAFTHTLIPGSVGTTGGIANALLYGEFGGNLASMNVNTGLIVNPSLLSGSVAAVAIDSVNNVIYATKSDYFTYGKLYKISFAGALLDSIDIGISPEALAVDYNYVTATTPSASAAMNLQTYPQPFGDQLHVDLFGMDAAAQKITIFDLSGRKLLAQDYVGNGIVTLQTAGLQAGAYILQVETRKGIATTKVIKM